ncbi:MAG: hypothetical protein ACOC4C_00870 [Fibrobacterota bacterium]
MNLKKIGYLFTVVLHMGAAAAYAQDTVRIIAGGETHGLVQPCDCPGQPGGGLAQRATVIEKQRADHNILLLDAGGFAAGGLYDDYSAGRHADSIRTVAMIEAMGMIGYDAVGVGDDDIQFGGTWLRSLGDSAALALVSANYWIRGDSSIASSYRMVKKGGLTFAITSLGTPELLFSVDRMVHIKDPISALNKVWPAMVNGSDVQIILSHLGEEQSWQLMEQFPEADIIINGHRKVMTAPAVVHKTSRAMMQFGFQGKQLSAIDLIVDSNGSLQLTNPQWLTVGEGEGDETIARHIENRLGNIPAITNTEIPQYDLYIMSQCPYGLAALKEILPLTRYFDLNLDIHFIGDVYGSDSLSSLHGASEIREEKIWLAIKDLYPEHWMDLLYLRVENDIATDEIIKILELDENKLQQWIGAYATRELAAHYRRSNRLHIEASPTLLIDGVTVVSELKEQRLSKELCERGQKLALCDSLPECFEDNQCKKDGKIGVCKKVENTGKCVFKDPVSFSFIAVVHDSDVDEYERHTIQTTRELFPGVDVKVLEYTSKRGRELYENNNARGLPFFLFEDKVEKAHNFDKVVSGIEKSNKWYRFKPGVMRKTFLPSREKKRSAVKLFIDPTFDHIDKVLKAVYTFDSTGSIIEIAPAWYGQPESVIVDTDSLTITDIWLGMRMFDPKQYQLLLSSFLPENIKGNSYALKEWVSDELLIRIHSHAQEVEKRKKDIASLDLHKPVELLVNNQRIIPIDSPEHLLEELQIVLSDLEK